MKKFSDFKKEFKRINESEEQSNSLEETKPNLPETTSTESDDEKSQDSPVGLFSKLFESREMAHIYHLQVRGDEGSYAKHMALNAYYESVLDSIDELIEVYQGQFSIVDGYDIIDTKETKSKDPVSYFEELADYIKNSRKCIEVEETHLHSIIDDIVVLVYKTLYKLKFNK